MHVYDVSQFSPALAPDSTGSVSFNHFLLFDVNLKIIIG